MIYLDTFSEEEQKKNLMFVERVHAMGWMVPAFSEWRLPDSSHR